MAGKNTDRKGKSKVVTTDFENVALFSLPESLPCSEVNFPILIKKCKGASWQQILDEEEKKLQEIEEFNKKKKEPIPKSPFLRTECDYIQNEVFAYLLPALVETLNKAKIWNALYKQHCFFNGIDHIAQVLWNSNPRYPVRRDANLHLFNMPWVRNLLRETDSTYLICPSPRPLYPKSWLWPEEYAATLIQKTVRQYFVQRDEEVQEMRNFWRKLEIERSNPEVETNPFLAKTLASKRDVHKPHTP